MEAPVEVCILMRLIDMQISIDAGPTDTSADTDHFFRIFLPRVRRGLQNAGA
jgi:hypothetical protein